MHLLLLKDFHSTRTVNHIACGFSEILANVLKKLGINNDKVPVPQLAGQRDERGNDNTGLTPHLGHAQILKMLTSPKTRWQSY